MAGNTQTGDLPTSDELMAEILQRTARENRMPTLDETASVMATRIREEEDRKFAAAVDVMIARAIAEES